MELDALMKFARAFDSVGWSVQQQLEDIIAGDYSDINPNALDEIVIKFRGYNEDLEDAIDAAVAASR